MFLKSSSENYLLFVMQMADRRRCGEYGWAV